MSELRPIPTDPDREQVAAVFRLDAEWLLSNGGEYQTAAVETMTDDGANWQRLIALEWPARVNHDHTPDGVRTVRLLVAPEDAIGLADVLTRTATWMLAAEQLGQ